MKITCFAYDEMITKLCKFMVTEQPVFPQINLMKTLNHLYRNFSRPPQGARNLFFKGLLTIDLGDLQSITPREIFEYLLTKCQDYGFLDLKHRNLQNLFFHTKDYSGTIPLASDISRKSSIASLNEARTLRPRTHSDLGDHPKRILLCTQASDVSVYKHHRTLKLEDRASENKLSLFFFLLNDEGANTYAATKST